LQWVECPRGAIYATLEAIKENLCRRWSSAKQATNPPVGAEARPVAPILTPALNRGDGAGALDGAPIWV